jgi:protein-S-isoprenylcysteine O-methyltransferase Ste14
MLWLCFSSFQNFHHLFLNVSLRLRYSILRHPSYVGFFYWAIGTQLVLCNPLSTLLYGLAAWTFFSKRIVYEESTLRSLFPGDYEEYISRTYIGIPLMSATSNDAKEE